MYNWHKIFSIGNFTKKSILSELSDDMIYPIYLMNAKKNTG